MCGRGPNRVWILFADSQVRGVFKDPDDAKWMKGRLAAEEDDVRNIEIETWNIE